MTKEILLCVGPEEGMTQALLHSGSVLWFFIDHPLDEILCHHILNVIQRILPLLNVWHKLIAFTTKRMVSTGEDVINQVSCRLKSQQRSLIKKMFCFHLIIKRIHATQMLTCMSVLGLYRMSQSSFEVLVALQPFVPPLRQVVWSLGKSLLMQKSANLALPFTSVR